MRTINFYDSLIIGSQELIQQNSYLREELYTLLNHLGNGFMGNRGILKKEADLGEILKVDIIDTTSPGTISVESGWGVGVVKQLDRDSMVPDNINGIPNALNNSPDILDEEYSIIFKIPNINNYVIPSVQSGSKNLFIHPVITVLEPGTCNVTSQGVVTFTDNTVTKRLRGQLSDSPVKLRFYQNRTSSTPYNNMDYEVIDVTGLNTAVISGQVPSNLNNFYCAIVGSYDLIKQPSIGNNFLYARIEGRIYFESGTATTKGGFPIYSFDFGGGGEILDWDDLRSENLYLLGSSEYIHPDTHPASIIVEGTDKRFVTDSEKRYVNTSIVTLNETTPSWDTDNGFRATLNLVGSRTLSITNMVNGDTGVLLVNNTGAFTLLFPVGSRFSFGRNSVEQGSGAVTMVSWLYIDNTFHFTLTPYTTV